MTDPKKRLDFSRFVVHLTRKYDNMEAKYNLINILRMKKIEARNAHCLFHKDFDKLNFSHTLKHKFKTVCFTEIPLHQIDNIVRKIPGRQIALKPYGLVFWRDKLLKMGANPAIYVNAYGTRLREFLKNQFAEQFKDNRKYIDLKKRDSFYEQIVQYYSMINIVSGYYDFTWEREWRYRGDFKFIYRQIVAIIAKNPEKFEEECNKVLPDKVMRYIKYTPIIDPCWNYEEIIEEIAEKLWSLRPQV